MNTTGRGRAITCRTGHDRPTRDGYIYRIKGHFKASRAFGQLGQLSVGVSDRPRLLRFGRGCAATRMASSGTLRHNRNRNPVGFFMEKTSLNRFCRSCGNRRKSPIVKVSHRLSLDPFGGRFMPIAQSVPQASSPIFFVELGGPWPPGTRVGEE